MGQQQLIVIVLGTLVVGLAVYTGVLLVQSNSQSNDEELIKQQLNIIVSEAVKYSAKIKSLGGGEGSFEGFKPQNNHLTTNQVRIVASFTSSTMIFQGFGTVMGLNGETPVNLVGVYDGAAGRWQTLTRVN